MERHRARRSRLRNHHHRKIRGIYWALRVALPYSGARRQRNDASARSGGGVAHRWRHYTYSRRETASESRRWLAGRLSAGLFKLVDPASFTSLGSGAETFAAGAQYQTDMKSIVTAPRNVR